MSALNVIKCFSLLVIISLANLSQASVFGKHIRGASTSENYPQTLSVGRFSQAIVDDKKCEWEHAGSIEIKTDRGNYDLGSYLVAPDAITVLCAGKKPFHIFNIPSKYLGDAASKGDVAVWFGAKKDRDGCEGYIGCDKVYVLEIYHDHEASNSQADVEQAPELQAW
jgi:hypothetical protein